MELLTYSHSGAFGYISFAYVCKNQREEKISFYYQSLRLSNEVLIFNLGWDSFKVDWW